jgi:hypothetical protein
VVRSELSLSIVFLDASEERVETGSKSFNFGLAICLESEIILLQLSETVCYHVLLMILNIVS